MLYRELAEADWSVYQERSYKPQFPARNGVRLTQPPPNSLAPRYTTGASREGSHHIILFPSPSVPLLYLGATPVFGFRNENKGRSQGESGLWQTP